MTDFSDCYFCGAVTADLEEYPVIPPETDPPEARQRTVMVCPTCREKLDRVIDPVVEHLEVDPPEGATEPDPDERGEAADSTSESHTEANDTDDVSELPSESRRILRLLDNRQFPIDREKIITVATNAYDLTSADVETVLDLLIEHDELTEMDGTLHRPE